jgi:hypothetical protein
VIRSGNEGKISTAPGEKQHSAWGDARRPTPDVLRPGASGEGERGRAGDRAAQRSLSDRLAGWRARWLASEAVEAAAPGEMGRPTKGARRASVRGRASERARAGERARGRAMASPGGRPSPPLGERGGAGFLFFFFSQFRNRSDLQSSGVEIRTGKIDRSALQLETNSLLDGKQSDLNTCWGKEQSESNLLSR